MSSQAAIRARDPKAAAHSLQLVLLVCGLAVAGLTVFTQQDASWVTQVASWTTIAALVATACCCRFAPVERLDRLGFFLAAPVVGVAIIVALNLQTHDAAVAVDQRRSRARRVAGACALRAVLRRRRRAHRAKRAGRGRVAVASA